MMLTALLVGACFIVFALLKRVDEANKTLKSYADSTMAAATKMQAQAPKQMDSMLTTLATSTAAMHDSLREMVRTVLVPPPVQFVDGPGGLPYGMPAQDEGKEPALWDHTDGMLPPPASPGPTVDPGYEHEADMDFDPDNPFGIPGMKFAV